MFSIEINFWELQVYESKIAPQSEKKCLSYALKTTCIEKYFAMIENNFHITNSKL